MTLELVEFELSQEALDYAHQMMGSIILKDRPAGPSLSLTIPSKLIHGKTMPDEAAVPNCQRYLQDSLSFLLPVIGCPFYLNNIRVRLEVAPEDQLGCSAEIDIVKESS